MVPVNNPPPSTVSIAEGVVVPIPTRPAVEAIITFPSAPFPPPAPGLMITLCPGPLNNEYPSPALRVMFPLSDESSGVAIVIPDRPLIELPLMSRYISVPPITRIVPAVPDDPI